MSIENHPNFFSAKFVTDCTASFFESLRGGAKEVDFDSFRDLLIEFASKVEELVDSSVD